MIIRFLLVVVLVATLFGGWLYLFDWHIKFIAKDALKKILISLVLAVITVGTLIFFSSNISGI